LEPIEVETEIKDYYKPVTLKRFSRAPLCC